MSQAKLDSFGFFDNANTALSDFETYPITKVKMMTDRYVSVEISPLQPGMGQTLAEMLKQAILRNVCGWAVVGIKAQSKDSPFVSDETTIKLFLKSMKPVPAQEDTNHDDNANRPSPGDLLMVPLREAARQQHKHTSKDQAAAIAPTDFDWESVGLLLSDNETPPEPLPVKNPACLSSVFLLVRYGSGYSVAEPLPADIAGVDHNTWALWCDAVFTPVSRVKTSVMPMLVKSGGKTIPRESLELEVFTRTRMAFAPLIVKVAQWWMDKMSVIAQITYGSPALAPEDVVRKASLLTFQQEKARLEDLRLSLKVYNLLRRQGFETLKDLADFYQSDKPKHIPRLGQANLAELLSALRQFGAASLADHIAQAAQT